MQYWEFRAINLFEIFRSDFRVPLVRHSRQIGFHHWTQRERDIDQKEEYQSNTKDLLRGDSEQSFESKEDDN